MVQAPACAVVSYSQSVKSPAKSSELGLLNVPS